MTKACLGYKLESFFNPLRPTGHWCPANVIAYTFTIKLRHLLFLGTADEGNVKIDKKKLKKYKIML